MRRYIGIIRNSLIEYFFFRVDYFFRILGNLLQISINFYIWKAIYANSTGELNGLTFLEAFTYVSVSSSIFVMIVTFVDWSMSFDIMSGDIVMRLYLPLDIHLQTVISAFSVFLFRAVFAGFPAILFIILIFKVPITIGINILFFVISVFFSFIISVNIDFAVGSSAFSFESALGLKLVKDNIILFLSGAIVPITFFPKSMQSVLMFLPFQAMYYTPVNLLLGNQSIINSLLLLCIQVGWILVFTVIGRLFYHKILVKLTISGG